MINFSLKIDGNFSLKFGLEFHLKISLEFVKIKQKKYQYKVNVFLGLQFVDLIFLINFWITLGKKYAPKKAQINACDQVLNYVAKNVLS